MTTFPIPRSVERFLGLTDPRMLKVRNMTFTDIDYANRMVVEAPAEAERRLAEEVRDTDSNGHVWAGLAKAWARKVLI